MGHPCPNNVTKCDPVTPYGNVQSLKSKENITKETLESMMHHSAGVHVWSHSVSHPDHEMYLQTSRPF